MTSEDKQPRIEGKVVIGMKNDVEQTHYKASNKSQESEDVFENDHNNNLCYLCDTCDDRFKCNIKGLNFSSSYIGMQTPYNYIIFCMQQLSKYFTVYIEIIIHLIFFLDFLKLNELICLEGGIDGSNIFIRKNQISEDVTEYFLPLITLIPPYNAGCFVKLYYNRNIVMDTIYISLDGHILKQSDKWKINKTTHTFYNLYQFSMRRLIQNREMTGNDESRIKISETHNLVLVHSFHYHF